jgi:DNA-binding transcriptional regulator YdaS (Cro superfamily)
VIREAGGASALAALIGTPKSHISAMQSGARGMGDALAAKIERKTERPVGWMDEEHDSQTS